MMTMENPMHFILRMTFAKNDANLMKLFGNHKIYKHCQTNKQKN